MVTVDLQPGDEEALPSQELIPQDAGQEINQVLQQINPSLQDLCREAELLREPEKVLEVMHPYPCSYAFFF